MLNLRDSTDRLKNVLFQPYLAEMLVEQVFALQAESLHLCSQSVLHRQHTPGTRVTKVKGQQRQLRSCEAVSGRLWI